MCQSKMYYQNCPQQQKMNLLMFIPCIKSVYNCAQYYDVFSPIKIRSLNVLNFAALY